MSLTCGAWLAERGGSLKLASDATTWFVWIGDQPLYSLRPVPVKGKIGCVILQTDNGRMVPTAATFPTQEEALGNGLEDLRKDLGWG
jgi:hypothetical protein